LPASNDFMEPGLGPLVTVVSVGQQVLWMPRIVFDLLAHLANKGSQLFEFISVLRSPHLFQQARMRDWLSGVKHQVVEHLEFLWRQVDIAPALLDPVLDRVELDLAEPDRAVAAVILGISSPRSRAQSRGQFT
jgi:hypothetical protein